VKATIAPLSSKAKNRFCNLMDGNASVIIEQEKDGVFFFVSANGRYCAWTARVGPDWHLTNIETTEP
jgi:hypothetical protein